jgi:hypothetical protein
MRWETMSETPPAFMGWSETDVRHFYALYEVFLYRTRRLHGHTEAGADKAFKVSIPKFVSSCVLERFQKLLEVSGYTANIVGHTWFIEPQKRPANEGEELLSSLDRLATLIEEKIFDRDAE